MKENCLDIGVIQAFMDGELEKHEIGRVTGHIALCDDCAALLAEAEDQSAVVFSALEREFNTLVPSQRLWTKINESIATERKERPFWQKAYAFASLLFASPSLTAAASLVIVLGVFAAVWMNKAPDVSTDTAAITTRPADVRQVVSTPPVIVSEPQTFERESQPQRGYTIERASLRSEPRRVNPAPSFDSNMASGYLPGEESYVKTISSLSKTVNEQKAGGVMRPGEQIAYERDMAVVNDAIAKMKQEVKRNPRNESAKQVLYSSYQNKIDLLNSVSQKEELMASLK